MGLELAISLSQNFYLALDFVDQFSLSNLLHNHLSNMTSSQNHTHTSPLSSISMCSCTTNQISSSGSSASLGCIRQILVCVHHFGEMLTNSHPLIPNNNKKYYLQAINSMQMNCSVRVTNPGLDITTPCSLSHILILNEAFKLLFDLSSLQI